MAIFNSKLLVITRGSSKSSYGMVFRYLSQRDSERGYLLVIRTFLIFLKLDPQWGMDDLSIFFPWRWRSNAINIGSYSFQFSSFQVVESPLYVCLKTMLHQGYDPQLARQRKAQILGWHLDSSPACFFYAAGTVIV